MKIFDNVDQQSEQWFRLRAGRVTASEFHRIFTPTGRPSSQYESYAIDLIAESFNPTEIKWSGNRHTDRGNELEPEARALFSEKYPQYEVRSVGFCTRDDGVVGCSPDALVYDDHGNLVAGLEIKCPTGANHIAILDSGQMPEKYKPQVHGSIGILGIPWYFMSYAVNMQPFITLINRDDYTEKLSAALDQFIIYYAIKRDSLIPQIKLK